MAFNAKLIFGKNEFDASEAGYRLKVDADGRGLSASDVYGGKITVRAESAWEFSTQFEHNLPAN